MRQLGEPLRCRKCNLDYTTAEQMHIYTCDLCDTCYSGDVFSTPAANESEKLINEILLVLVLQNERIHEKLEKVEMANTKIMEMLNVMTNCTRPTDGEPSYDDDEPVTISPICEQVDHTVRSVGSSELKVVVTRCSPHGPGGGLGRFYQVN